LRGEKKSVPGGKKEMETTAKIPIARDRPLGQKGKEHGGFEKDKDRRQGPPPGPREEKQEKMNRNEITKVGTTPLWLQMHQKIFFKKVTKNSDAGEDP